MKKQKKQKHTHTQTELCLKHQHVVNVLNNKNTFVLQTLCRRTEENTHPEKRNFSIYKSILWLRSAQRWPRPSSSDWTGGFPPPGRGNAGNVWWFFCFVPENPDRWRLSLYEFTSHHIPPKSMSQSEERWHSWRLPAKHHRLTGFQF